ncbi:hypothetical protein C2G38_2049536 [Gigaspora rosea]|uniref:Uncharacterized protein n=1 Tax=Gigaspora rosea TaxID=44941 RepID=A0A397U0A7_9GLOM|nr:hypothetical protein C2G38_2049536 [Gigaspora rosea]
MRSKRGILTTKIKDVVFAVFGDSMLDRIDSNAIPEEVHNWKQSAKTKAAYSKLFLPIATNDPEDTYISCILTKVFSKGVAEENLIAFGIGVAQALLSPKYEKITIEEKIMKDRIEKNVVKI